MPRKKLTDIAAERTAPPEKGRLELWDTVTTGLCLRITSKNVRTWNFVYRIGGIQRRMTLGHFPAISVLKARSIAKKALEDIAVGVDPIAHRQDQIQQQIKREEEAISVERLSEEFIERYARPKNRRWKYSQQIFANHINPELGHMAAKDVKRKDVIRLLDKIKASGRPHAANHVLATLRKAYNWGIERDELQFNPCHMISKPVPPKERERVLSKDEIRSLWQFCETQAGYPMGPLTQLLLLTGARRSEISALKWDHIDLEENVIRLPPENVKTKKGHEIPLAPLAIDILMRLPRFNGPFIFSSTHGLKPTNGFGKAKRQIDENLKIDPWRIHDLRRSCATGLAQLGIPLHTISRVLGHAEGGTTKIYARHSYLNEKRRALEIWAQHIQDTLQSPKNDNVIKMERKIY